LYSSLVVAQLISSSLLSFKEGGHSQYRETMYPLLNEMSRCRMWYSHPPTT